MLTEVKSRNVKTNDTLVIEQVCENFLNSRILSCLRCERGVASRNYKVCLTSGLTVLLRIDERRSTKDIDYDNMLMTEAAQNGVHIASAFHSWESSEGVTVAVRPWIEGMVQADIGPVFGNRLHELGRTLARIHNVKLSPLAGSGRQFFYAPIYNRSESCWKLLELVPRQLSDFAGAQGTVNTAIRIVSRADRTTFPYSPIGLTHGDFSPSNVVINSNTLFVIDWEKSCFGPIYSDVAQVVYYFLTAFGNHNEANVAKLLQGYRSERVIENFSALQDWCYLHPFYIFLHDTARTISKQIEGQSDHLDYYMKESLPRFKKHLHHYR